MYTASNSGLLHLESRQQNLRPSWLPIAYPRGLSLSHRGLANGLFDALTALGTYAAPWLGFLFVHKEMNWQWTLGSQLSSSTRE